MGPALRWYEENGRDLPWRRTKDPYRIWVSEIMLQQTRVEAVTEYYRRFTEALPDIHHLATCEDDRLLKLWEGLGYYNRVRNMKSAAQEMEKHYGGKMPADYEKILTLPGIGAYTAGAIASIAYDLPAPAVDGNVLRILCRVTKDDRDIKKESTKKLLTNLLWNVMPKTGSGAFNQAMMDIGAILCLPKGSPRCTDCPWERLCGAHLCDQTDRYPYRSPAKERRLEKRTVFLIMDGDRILIEKRPKKGLLAGLYQFPNREGYFKKNEAIDLVRSMGLDPLKIEVLPDAKHVFSHIEWQMKGYLIRVSDLGGYGQTRDALLVKKSRIESDYAIPSAFEVYAKEVNLMRGKQTINADD